MAQLSMDSRLQYTERRRRPKGMSADYQRVMDEMIVMLPKAFHLRSRAPRPCCSNAVFQRSKLLQQAYADAGYLDGARPPTFYVNLGDMSAQPKFSLRTITYHEGRSRPSPSGVRSRPR